MPAPKKHPAYNKNGEGGRPRKYSAAEIDTFADEFLKWLKTPTNLWFKDFCLEKDIDPDLMSEWAKENERFCGAYRLAKAKQESRLVNGGLMELYNGSIVKFVLANAHGWADKQEAKVSGDAASPLAFLLQRADGKSKDLVNEDDT
jgi:hypothetical protein